jgi:hypothetical protein
MNRGEQSTPQKSNRLSSCAESDGWNFGGLLSQTAMNKVVGMGKNREQCSKKETLFERDIKEWRVLDLFSLLLLYSLGEKPLAKRPNRDAFEGKDTRWACTCR